MCPFRFGLIGVGVHAQYLSKILLADSAHRAEIHSICDLNPQNLEKMVELISKETGKTPKTYQQYQDLVEDPEIDVIMILSPDFTHYEIALAAFKQKKHVFLEKPAGINLDQMYEIVTAAKASGKILEMGYVLRYAPFYAQIKKFLDNDELGRPLFASAIEQFYGGAGIYFRNWWRFRKNHGGLMHTKISHDLDLMYWFFGKPKTIFAVKSVMEFKPGNWDSDAQYCHECENHCPYYITSKKSRNQSDECVYNTDKTGADICDNAQVVVQFESGLNMTLGMNFFNSHHQDDRFISIIGSKTEIQGRLSEQMILVNPRHDATDSKSYCLEFALPGQIGHAGGNVIQINEFLDAISENREARAGLASAYWSSILVMGAQLSADSNKIIDVQELTAKYPFNS